MVLGKQNEISILEIIVQSPPSEGTEELCPEQSLCLKSQMAVDSGSPEKTRGKPALSPHPTIPYTLAQVEAAPTSLWCSLRFRRLADLRHDEGVFTLTAGQHDMVAGVAKVGVGFT